MLPPPAPLWPSPLGVVVVVVADFVVVVVAPLDDDEPDELVDPGVIDVPVVVAVVVPVVLPVVLPVLLAVLDGFVVVEDAWFVDFLPPKSPGCAIASTMPAPKTTIATTIKSDARCFSVQSSSWERVTGVEPASPAWKAGALPLSYTRVHGWNVVGRT